MQQLNELIERSIDTIYPSKEAFLKRVKKGEKLKIYLGVDPTTPHLHLGHAVNLLILRRFQELGHKCILLIGDFTAMIGDPTDKSATRQQLTRDEVKKNLAGYKKQASAILDFKGKNPVKIEFNSKWWGKMSAEDILKLQSKFTAQQILHREMFKKRTEADKSIGLHELSYPMMQAYDSVAMDVDAELGGTDQTFNMLAGRDLMKSMKNKDKIVIVSKLLVNPETNEKMSKTGSNLINLDDEPNDMFGKVMAVQDAFIIPLAELSTLIPQDELKEIKESLNNKKTNPKNIKMRVAKWVVQTYHGEQLAQKAEEEFKRVFESRELPTDMDLLRIGEEKINIIDLLVVSDMASSKSDARRLIDQGAVKIDGEKVKSAEAEINVSEERTLQVGKHRFLKITN